MLALFSVCGIAFLFSMSIHIGVLLNIFDFTPELQFLLKGLFGILFVIVFFVLEKKRREIGKENFAKEFKGAIPEWMKTGMGFFSIYGVGVFLFSLGRAFSTASVTKNTEATVGQFNVGLSALIMMGFSLAFCMIVICKRINKNRDSCLKEDD